uniref:Uncharacterized protein n=1 Tax=Sphaerodactylus townsendi TaxID=933632 RepID=A0ACB8F040_9SAUR
MRNCSPVLLSPCSAGAPHGRLPEGQMSEAVALSATKTAGNAEGWQDQERLSAWAEEWWRSSALEVLGKGTGQAMARWPPRAPESLLCGLLPEIPLGQAWPGEERRGHPPHPNLSTAGLERTVAECRCHPVEETTSDYGFVLFFYQRSSY